MRGVVAPDWRIDDAAIAALRRLPWRGNVRELRSALTRLTLEDRAGVLNTGRIGDLAAGDAAGGPAAEPSLRETLHERIRAVHRGTAGNISETVRRLGVSRNTVYRALPHPPD